MQNEIAVFISKYRLKYNLWESKRYTAKLVLREKLVKLVTCSNNNEK